MTFWVAGAVVGSTIIGSAVQSDAARRASNTQSKATDAAIGEQRRQFDLTRADTQYLRDAGPGALAEYQRLNNTPTSAADAQADPGYAFAQQQGQLGLDRKIAAMGGRVSGRALKASSEFNAGNATRFYGAADQRRENRLQRIAALLGISQGAVSTSAAAGANSSNAISDLISSQGNATAAGQVAQGNIWGNAVNQLGAAFGRGASPNAINATYNLPNYAIDPYGGG